MPRSAHRLSVAVLAAVLVGSFVACSTTATTAPPTTPAPATAEASAAPSPADAGNIVPLEGATGNAISVEITDASGLLLGAESGTPGDGASVAPYELVVTNDDESTLRLVWAGGPCDAVDSLAIDASARAFLLVEPECQGDAVAFDRVLILHFAAPVPASEVQAILQDGLDTAG